MRKVQPLLPEFHRVLSGIWSTVQAEWEARSLDYESDVQASVYHHLREVYDARHAPHRIWYELKRGGARRPDIAFQLGREELPWVELEFKWLFGGRPRWAESDMQKIRKDFRDVEGPVRAYFCFVANPRDGGWVRDVRRDLDALARWAHGKGVLYFAEGFFLDTPEGERRAIEPWKLWPAGNPP